MTVTGRVRSDNRLTWDEALMLYQGQLSFYLDYLMECDCRSEILAKVATEVRERFVPDEFKFRVMVRALIRVLIQHLRECVTQSEHSRGPVQGQLSYPREVPTQERLVYFMREILEYSTRDVSLLIGITDIQVEKLLSFARKRIDVSYGPSDVGVCIPEWTQFRWKLRDFHLN